MGGKNSSTNAATTTRQDIQSAWLVVLHKSGQEIKNIKYLLDALNACPPVGNVDVGYDYKPVEIQDGGDLAEDVSSDIKNCLENGRIVLICFLANGKTKCLWEQVEKHEKIIMLRYKEPDVDEPLPQEMIVIDEDFQTAGPDEMTEEVVREIADKILAKNNQ